jgi:hypothetical protein
MKEETTKITFLFQSMLLSTDNTISRFVDGEEHSDRHTETNRARSFVSISRYQRHQPHTSRDNKCSCAGCGWWLAAVEHRPLNFVWADSYKLSNCPDQMRPIG